jgi:hypothetical protein
MSFLLSKNCLCMWISAYPLAKKWFFSQCSISLVGMRFFRHVPNSLKNKNVERHIPHLLKKIVFLAFNTLLSPWAHGKNFSSTLNVMIMQMVRNECTRFGLHVNIQVSYKILQLEVLKESSIFAQSTLLWIGVVLRQFWWKHPKNFRGSPFTSKTIFVDSGSFECFTHDLGNFYYWDIQN